MTYTKIVVVYCSVAFILLLSLLAGLATSNVLDRIYVLEDKVVKLEFELVKQEILSDVEASDDKYVVVIPDRLIVEAEAEDNSKLNKLDSNEISSLDIQGEVK